MSTLERAVRVLMGEVPVEGRWELAERLERQAAQLTGVRKDGWVDDRSVCSSCRHAHITRRGSANHRVIVCRQLGRPVPHDLSECNSYQNVTELTLQQMSDIAVLIDPRDLLKEGYR